MDGDEILESAEQIFNSGCAKALESTTELTNVTGSYSMFSTAFHILEGVGLALLLLYFLYGLVQEASKDSFTLDHLFKKLVYVAVAGLLITNSVGISSEIVRFGNSVATQISSGFNTEEDKAVTAKWENDEEPGFIKRMLVSITITIFNFISFGFYIVASFQIFSRYIELMVRGAFLPLAIGDIFGGGAMHGERYLRKYLAVALQAGVMIMCCYAGGYLFGEKLGGEFIVNSKDWLTTLGTYFIVQVAVIGAMGKSIQICNDICGC